MKTGIVVLALLGLCFFCGVGNGLLATKDPLPPAKTPIPTPSWGKKLDDLLPHGKLTFDDISSNDDSCLDTTHRQLKVTQSKTCSYTLSTTFLPRNGSLQLVKGFQANVKIRQPVKEDGSMGITTDDTLGSSGSVKFRLSSRQSKTDMIELTVSCPLGDIENEAPDPLCRLEVTEPQAN